MLLWTLKLHFWEPKRKLKPKSWKKKCSFSIFFLVFLTTKTILSDCSSGQVCPTCFQFAPKTKRFTIPARKQIHKLVFSKKSFFSANASSVKFWMQFWQPRRNFGPKILTISTPFAIFELNVRKNSWNTLLDMCNAFWTTCVEFGQKAKIFVNFTKHLK